MNRVHDSSRLARLDLNLFRVFDVVFRERNLTRAAEVLSLSQSAVSHALARLREQFGEPLFAREGRGVAPTPLAERLAPEIREALALLQQAVHRTGHFEPTRDAAHITLAMNDELEPSLLCRWVARLHTQAPQARVTSIRLDRRRLERELASGRLDLAIDVAQPTSSELRHTVLLRDSFCVVSARRQKLEAETYLAARHVAVSSRRTGPAIEDLLLSRLGTQRHVSVRCQHYEAACRIVSGSALLLTMPRRRAEELQAALGNHLLPMPLMLPAMDLHLYWHRQVDEDPRSRWLRSELLALAST
ncbi:LysR family transcriptional regulator [Stigmatella aurantiaca]|uniref:Transcriptional regulator, LysR family n=1 Tax=Stigmatella aurantiaca (strain DW4/3-1) TaxID=378806 RepID=Q09DE9_STIAD|nr:LysR family transcriptional regulator [Stigmatella aurantiaca]ADO69362.1 Transcriptional regulator, LysR family [Stigmatella aurantiaca DW4/3-1]EAU69769.1 transcriptional regulator, LysR family [Stigmatella aurantiaca DW4/3-1]